MPEAFLVGGARMPVGRHGGTVGCAPQSMSVVRGAGVGGPPIGAPDAAGTPTLTESEHDMYLIDMG